MDILLPFFVFLFGLIAGSFLNALLHRFQTGRGMGGRSQCASCGAVLSARDLVPLLSYALLGGKCRHCRARISPSYPLIEILAGLLVLFTYLGTPDTSTFLIHSSLWLILLFIATYDLKHLVIPAYFAEALALASFVALFLEGHTFVLPSLYALLAGPLTALPLFLLFLVSHGRWMGFGDPKLALGLGWFLGLEEGIAALLFSFWIGALISLFLLLRAAFRGKEKRLTMKSEVPFAPFLITGAALAYFTNATETLTAFFF